MGTVAAEKEKPQLREGVRLKFINKWAGLYVDRLTKLGKEKAVEWGMSFFHKDDVPYIAAKAKEILKGKGLL